MDFTSESAMPMTPAKVEHGFTFNGSGAEYFRIWIVNLLLTLFTIGIYGAWAKVRRLRYFYRNTELAGAAFEYHGEPKKILKGRMIAGALILPYYLLQSTHPLWSLLFLALFLIALPFIIVQSRRFQMRMTSWRNIRFGFDGTYGSAARNYLGLGVLIPLTLGLIFPYSAYAKQRFVISNTRFGQTKFEFGAKPGRFYSAYSMACLWFLAALLASMIMLVIAVTIAGLFLGISRDLFSGQLNLQEAIKTPGASLIIVIASIAGYLTALCSYFAPSAVAKARITNEVFSHTSIGTHQLQSNLSAKKLFFIYLTNLIGIVFTLGLFAPWAKVRLIRYQLENTQLVANGSLDDFAGTNTASISATGEELGDFLDVDFGL